jgi:hypothetical protein
MHVFVHRCRSQVPYIGLATGWKNRRQEPPYDIGESKEDTTIPKAWNERYLIS